MIHFVDEERIRCGGGDEVHAFLGIEPNRQVFQRPTVLKQRCDPNQLPGSGDVIEHYAIVLGRIHVIEPIARHQRPGVVRLVILPRCDVPGRVDSGAVQRRGGGVVDAAVSIPAQKHGKTNRLRSDLDEHQLAAGLGSQRGEASAAPSTDQEAACPCDGVPPHEVVFRQPHPRVALRRPERPLLLQHPQRPRLGLAQE